MASILENEEWEEVNNNENANETISTIDLFSDQVFNTPKEACEYMITEYKFDVLNICSQPNVGIYGAIKIINYIRYTIKQGGNSSEINTIINKFNGTNFMEGLKEQFLTPVIPNDPLILYITSSIDAFDEFSDDEDDNDESDDEVPEFEDEENVTNDNNNNNNNNNNNTDESMEDMVERFNQLSTNAKENMFVQMKAVHDENLHLKEMLKRCQGMLRSLVANDDNNNIASSTTTTGDDDNLNNSDGPDNDTYYFDSYSHYGIHETMLKDKSRTNAYKDAMLKNPKLFAGKVVLDIGCGTGILSMFAAKAGAKHVIGIDMSDMAFRAMEIVLKNGFQNQITILHGKVENIKLPDGIDKVDIIVSEWMGYALVYECMLETVLVARDQWLKPQGGVMFPNSATVHLGGLSDMAIWNDKVNYWENVYEYDMMCMQKDVLQEADVTIVNPKSIFTPMIPIWDLDIQTIKPSELDLVATFKLSVQKEGQLIGFVISFDCDFNEQCEVPIVLKTGPDSVPTHWKQTLVYLKIPSKMLKVNTIIEGIIEIKRNEKNPRFLDIKFDLEKSKDLLQVDKLGSGDEEKNSSSSPYVFEYQLQ